MKTIKRGKKVMLRFTKSEYDRLMGDMPPGECPAVYLRERLLLAADLKTTAAFIVAALSDTMQYDQALAQYEEVCR